MYLLLARAYLFEHWLRPPRSMNLTMLMSIRSSNFTRVCLNIAFHVKSGSGIIKRGVEPVTRDATVTEIFENVG